MRIASTVCLFLLLAAAPVSSEISVAGGSEFGVSQNAASECGDQTVITAGCYSDTLDAAPNPGGPRISITGEAKMGLVYDGQSVRPLSKVSITISLDTVTDGGMQIHGSTTLPSVQ